jgi:hypothetical protein
MSFLQNYLTYNSGNECPEEYHLWSALVVLANVVSRRVYLDMEYFQITPNLYVTLVGTQGNRKTVAKDIAYDMLREVCPDIPVSAESESKEAITQYMAKPEQARHYVDPTKGERVEYHPYGIFATELKNFLSINQIVMVDFLTTIYDRKFYDVKTKNKGVDIIKNPCVNFLACETPEWIIARLKESVISGGFCRRMIFVYSTGQRKRIAFPKITDEQRAAFESCKQWLRDIKDIQGVVTFDDEARTFYEDWYNNIKFPDDPFMRGWFESKHVQMLKVAILVMVSETKELILRLRHIQVALEFINGLEKNLPKLGESVGRNELALPTNKIVDIVANAGGAMLERQVQALMMRDLNGVEFMSAIHSLVGMEKLVKLKLRDPKTNIEKMWLLTPEKALTVKERAGSVLSSPTPSASPAGTSKKD